MDVRTTEAHNVLVGGGELGRCGTRIHHDRFTDAPFARDPVAERRIAEGRRWERTVVDQLLDGLKAGVVGTASDPFDRTHPVVVASGVPAEERETITRALLHAGVPLIVGGRLTDAASRSVGAPDLLVRLDDGYAPVDIKHHKVVDNRGIPCRLTPIGRLGDTNGASTAFRTARVNDLLQVAHYWTLLDSAGYASPRRLVGVIGSEPSLVCLWTDLDAGTPPIETRYWTALSNALRVVDAGRLHPNEPVVAPMWRGECRSCPWARFCRSELEAVDHVSLLPGVGPAATERLVGAGIATTAKIGDLSDEALDTLDITSEARLQARAREAGLLIHRAGADLALPDVRIEIDFDVETYRGMLYLAGLLVTDERGSRFEPIADWSGTAEGERQILSDLFAFFDEVAERGGAVVYHWTGYERTILNEAAHRHGLMVESASSVDEWFDHHAVDLHRWVKDRFVSPSGYSLKVIAPLCGFDWRDDDPGGAQSELWYEALLAGDDSQRLRLLDYNEDDVAAQLAIRRWVRES
ncbi:MAG: TM0106 family RecB-like putative nuclease [Actinomycetota bacterium]